MPLQVGGVHFINLSLSPTLPNLDPGLRRDDMPKKSQDNPACRSSTLDYPKRWLRELGSSAGGSSAFVEPCQHEFSVPKCLRRGKTPISGAQHHFEQLVAHLVEHHVTLQQAG